MKLKPLVKKMRLKNQSYLIYNNKEDVRSLMLMTNMNIEKINELVEEVSKIAEEIEKIKNSLA